MWKSFLSFLFWPCRVCLPKIGKNFGCRGNMVEMIKLGTLELFCGSGADPNWRRVIGSQKFSLQSPLWEIFEYFGTTWLWSPCDLGRWWKPFFDGEIWNQRVFVICVAQKDNSLERCHWFCIKSNWFSTNSFGIVFEGRNKIGLKTKLQVFNGARNQPMLFNFLRATAVQKTFELTFETTEI